MMTPDEMRQKAGRSSAAAKEALERGCLPQTASSFTLEATLWLIGAEICERLDGIGGEDRAEVLEDRERGMG
jgi:hypothetical protein